MARTEPKAEEEHFGEARLAEAQAANPPSTDDVIEPDAEPVDTEVDEADLAVVVDEVGEEEAEEQEHPD